MSILKREPYVAGPYDDGVYVGAQAKRFVARYIRGSNTSIGITNDPERRFAEHRNGGRSWATDMVVVWESEDRGAVASVEDMLIHRFLNGHKIRIDPHFIEDYRGLTRSAEARRQGPSYLYILTDSDPRAFGAFSHGFTDFYRKNNGR